VVQITAENQVTAPGTARHELVVLHREELCPLFRRFASRVQEGSALYVQLDERATSLNRSMWWRDVANVGRDMVNALLGGLTGKELSDGNNGTAGIGAGATAAWMAFSGKIPGIASSTDARDQRKALRASADVLRGQVQNFHSDFAAVSNRDEPAFEERSKVLLDHIDELRRDHEDHGLGAVPEVTDDLMSQRLNIVLAPPAGC
jgi:hypothetical protein